MGSSALRSCRIATTSAADPQLWHVMIAAVVSAASSVMGDGTGLVVAAAAASSSFFKSPVKQRLGGRWFCKKHMSKSLQCDE